MTTEELGKLTVNGVPGVNLVKNTRKKNARDKFELTLQEEEKKANSNKLPFARHVAREDFDGALKVQIDKQLREYGSVEHPEELKLPVIDWNKYSDLTNFELTREHERPDSQLTKHNPGLNVKLQVKTYKFKGYRQIYKVMESAPDAITRAVKKRAELDNAINVELEPVTKK